jgi:hypothetical protein
MLTASRRNMILFAGGSLALTIALLDDQAPNRLIAHSDAVAQRRATEADSQTAGGDNLQPERGVWDSPAAIESGQAPTGNSASEGVAVVSRAVEDAPAAATVIAAQPPAALSRDMGRRPVPGVRERSNPLGRNYADDGSRAMAEDIRQALG